MASMIEIRVLTPDYWELWRELRLGALADAPQAFGATLEEWQGEGDREERWRARLGIPGSHNLVALLDGRPAGMVSGVPTGEDGIAELISMWVSPSAGGSAVGDRLVDEVARWASRTGARELRLSVMPGNARAIALYRRNRFDGLLADDGDGSAARRMTRALHAEAAS